MDDSPITSSPVVLFLLPVSHLKMGTGWPNQAYNDEWKMAGVVPNSDVFVQDSRTGLSFRCVCIMCDTENHSGHPSELENEIEGGRAKKW